MIMSISGVTLDCILWKCFNPPKSATKDKALNECEKHCSLLKQLQFCFHENHRHNLKALLTLSLSRLAAIKG